MGEVRSRATLDHRPFAAGIDRMDKGVKGFNGNLGKVRNIVAGSFAVGAIASFTRNIVEASNKIGDLSAQTGLSTDMVQALSHSFRLAGVDQQRLFNVMRNLQSRMGSIARGEGKEYEKALNDLNISTVELMSLSPEQVLERVAKGYADAGKSLEAYRLVQKVIGEESGPKLIEFLGKLADVGLKGVQDEAKKAGVVMDESVVKKMSEASDATETFWQKLKSGTANWFGRTGESFATLYDAAVTRQGAFELEDYRENQKQILKDLEAEEVQKKRNIAATQALRDEVERGHAEDRQALADFITSYEKILDMAAQAKIPTPVDPMKGIRAPTSNNGDWSGVGGFSGAVRNGMDRKLDTQIRLMRISQSHLAAINAQLRNNRTLTIAEP